MANKKKITLKDPLTGETLPTIVKSPVTTDVVDHHGDTQRISSERLDKLLELGRLTQEEYDRIVDANSSPSCLRLS